MVASVRGVVEGKRGGRCSLDLVLSLRITVCVCTCRDMVCSTDETVFIIDISYQCTLSPPCFKCCSYELHSLKFCSSFAWCMVPFITVLFCSCLFYLQKYMFVLWQSQIISFVVWGQSCALLWQAGCGHSKPTCNHEAQHGSVKLNFLLQLRLLTSPRVLVNPV